MAAIDKIYGSRKQYDEFRAWAREVKPDILRYFYVWTEEWLIDGKSHPITSFPLSVDIWLLVNCSLEWVVDYIKDQYSEA